MSGFETAIFLADTALGGLSVASGLQQSKANRKRALAQHNAQMSNLLQQREIEDKKRRDQLRRAQAAQRARFGAAGIGAGSSASAVLSGMEKRSSSEFDDAWNLRYRRAEGDSAMATERHLERAKRRERDDLLAGGLRLASRGRALLGSNKLGLLD